MHSSACPLAGNLWRDGQDGEGGLHPGTGARSGSAYPGATCCPFHRWLSLPACLFVCPSTRRPPLLPILGANQSCVRASIKRFVAFVLVYFCPSVHFYAPPPPFDAFGTFLGAAEERLSTSTPTASLPGSMCISLAGSCSRNACGRQCQFC
jgi:hypothetical protein